MTLLIDTSDIDELFCEFSDTGVFTVYIRDKKQNKRIVMTLIEEQVEMLYSSIKEAIGQ